MRNAESIYIKPKRTGVIRGQTLVKSIHHVNRDTGNVSLTYEEWDIIHSGEIQYLVIHHAGCKPMFLEITDGMVNSAWQCAWRSCIIMNYTVLN